MPIDLTEFDEELAKSGPGLPFGGKVGWFLEHYLTEEQREKALTVLADPQYNLSAITRVLATWGAAAGASPRQCPKQVALRNYIADHGLRA